MARDSSLPVRRALLTMMKADAPLVALVPAARHYPSEVPGSPVWPFIRCGVLIPAPFRASCMDGSRIVGSVHGFTKALMNGSQLVASAEGQAYKIAAAIAASVDNRPLPLVADYPARGFVNWTGSQVLQDPAEAGAWHAVVSLEVSVTS